jgi:hypothetical protein
MGKRKRLGGRGRKISKIIVRNNPEAIATILNNHAVGAEVQEFILENQEYQDDDAYYVIDMADIPEPSLDAIGLTYDDIIEGYEFNRNQTSITNGRDGRFMTVEVFAPEDEGRGSPKKRREKRKGSRKGSRKDSRKRKRQ